jgi:hypothetical protein
MNRNEAGKILTWYLYLVERMNNIWEEKNRWKGGNSRWALSLEKFYLNKI